MLETIVMRLNHRTEIKYSNNLLRKVEFIWKAKLLLYLLCKSLEPFSSGKNWEMQQLLNCGNIHGNTICKAKIV